MSEVMGQIKKGLLPGVSHWNHPNYYSFFPSNCSPSTMFGFLLSHVLNERNDCGSLMASHLEELLLEWGARMLSLPAFLHPSENAVGEVANTASESFRIMGAVAKQLKIKKLGLKYEDY